MLAALQALLNLAANFLPDRFRPVAQLIVGILGTVNFPPGDPKIERVAEIIAGLATDLAAALELPDATAQEAARATIINRAHRLLADIAAGTV